MISVNPMTAKTSPRIHSEGRRSVNILVGEITKVVYRTYARLRNINDGVVFHELVEVREKESEIDHRWRRLHYMN